MKYIKSAVMVTAVFLLCAACASETPSPSETVPQTAPTVTPVEKTASPEPESPVEAEPSEEAHRAFPEQWNDGGIFRDSYPLAYEKLTSLTLEEKVGQIFLARCPANNAEDTIKSYHPSGFVLFGSDFKGKTKEQVISELRGYQNSSSIPMLLAVDEEGGSVVRISSNPLLRESKFQSPQQLFKKGGLDAVRDDALEKTELLAEFGLNVNLAPVADVSTNRNDYIYNRTFGKPADETAVYVAAVVEACNGTKISCTLKHFPGYGNNKDTHTGATIDERTLESFVKSDFVPFKAGIDAGAESVLVSHNVVVCMDEARPSSLSPEVHRVLREDLGFTGVIMTDDLAMNAITAYTDEHPAVQAVLSGNDLLIITDLAGGYASVLNAVNDGKITPDQLDRAVFRVLAWKYAKGIME